MDSSNLTAEEIGQRGQTLYDAYIRNVVEPEHRGEFVAVDINTGEYEIDRDQVAAVRRARSKRPDNLVYIVRVGFAAAHRIGGRMTLKDPE